MPFTDWKSQNCTAPLPFLRCKVRKWEPLWLDACAPVSAVCRWLIRGACSSVREQSKRKCGQHLGLKKAEILQDTQSCIVTRPSDEGSDADPSHRASYVYVDNLGVLGTSRVNVDKDLMMAVQTLEIVVWIHMRSSNTATALGIHIDLRIMLVSVAPMRLRRLKQEIRWALRCRALPGKTWEALLEHMTFVALLRRDVLSVPFALNKFIRANYNDSARLWRSARTEVQASVGLLPAIASSWWRQMQASMVSVFV